MGLQQVEELEQEEEQELVQGLVEELACHLAEQEVSPAELEVSEDPGNDVCSDERMYGSASTNRCHLHFPPFH